MKNKKKHPDTMTIWEHIVALKRVVIKSIFLFLLSAGTVHYFRESIISFLLQPLGDSSPSLQFLSPLDPLFFILKIDFTLGLLISIPFIFFFIWDYVSPAVPIHKWVPYVAFSFVSAFTFLAAAYSYLLVTPIVLNFMNSITIPGTTTAFTAMGYLSFLISTTLVLVLVFQLPVFIFILCALGIIHSSEIKNKRPYIYLILIIFSAIITPTTDVITLALVCLPGIIAVELGLLASKLFLKRKTV